MALSIQKYDKFWRFMKKYSYIDVGNRLKELRGNLSQKEFAEKIDVSFRTYQRYEAGETLPPEPVLERVAELYNTTVDWILRRDFDKEIEEYNAQFKNLQETYKSMGVIPKAAISDDEVSILKILRDISYEDSIEILKILIEKYESDRFIVKSEYAKQHVIRVKEIIKRGEFAAGLDLEGLLWGFEKVFKHKKPIKKVIKNKKTPEDTEESGGHGMVGDHPRLDQDPKLGGNSYLEEVG